MQQNNNYMHKQIKVLYNPWVICMPMFIILLLIIALTGANIPLSDGIRYWQTAGYFLNGFSDVDLINSSLLKNGPLYPFFLSLLRVFGFGVKTSIYFNAIFIYLSGVLFFKLLKKNLSFLFSFIAVYSWFFIDPFLFYWGAKLYSEPLAILLVISFIYQVDIYFINKSKRSLILASIFFSLLILTKVLFGYVCIVLILVFGVNYLIKRKKWVKDIFKIFLFSFLFILPYLTFTYSITGKYFYFSTGGGKLLYWISSPHENDLGEWHIFALDNLKDHLGKRYNKFSGLDSSYLARVNQVIIDQMKADHKSVVEKINFSNFNAIEEDDYLKKEALKNISNFPLNFAKNWILNSGRLLIGYPHAIYFKPPYSPLLSLLNIFKSTLVLFIFIISTFLFLRYSIKDPPKMMTLIYLIIIFYFAGQSLLAVQSQRFLLPIYPLIVYVSSTFLSRHIKLIT